MKTTRQTSLDWWNSIGKTMQDELSLEYFGLLSYYTLDSEIEQMWLKEFPHEKTYTKEDLEKAFEAGQDQSIYGVSDDGGRGYYFTYDSFEDWFKTL